MLIHFQHSLEQAENLIKGHEAFITTMDANDEKINNVLQFAQRLTDENHYASDQIQQKADNINDRYIFIIPSKSRPPDLKFLCPTMSTLYLLCKSVLILALVSSAVGLWQHYDFNRRAIWLPI